jgi:hypothetical protein
MRRPLTSSQQRTDRRRDRAQAHAAATVAEPAAENPFRPAPPERPRAPEVNRGATSALMALCRDAEEASLRTPRHGGLGKLTPRRRRVSVQPPQALIGNNTMTSTSVSVLSYPSRSLRSPLSDALSRHSGSSDAALQSAAAAPVVGIGRHYYAGAYYVPPQTQTLDRVLTRMTMAVDAGPDGAHPLRREWSALTPAQRLLLSDADIEKVSAVTRARHRQSTIW